MYLGDSGLSKEYLDLDKFIYFYADKKLKCSKDSDTKELKSDIILK